MKKYSELDKIIDEKTVLISGELAERITQNFNVKEVNARQIINRAKSPIIKMSLGFKNKQSLVFHKDIDKKILYKKIKEYMQRYSKAYYEVIMALENNYGYMKKERIANYLSSPIEKIQGHVIADDIIKKLILEKIILETDDNLIQLNPNFVGDEDFIENAYSYYKASEMERAIVIESFKELTRNTNMVSYNSVTTIRERPNFASFQWSFVAPSYIGGIKRKKGNNNDEISCFVIADIILGNISKRDYLDYFMKKIKIINCAKNPPLYIPILICENLPADSFKEFKEEGIVIAKIKELFGDKYVEILKELLEILTESVKLLKEKPDKYLEKLEKIYKEIQGGNINLKGHLFEFAIAYLYSKEGRIKYIGKRIFCNNENREIDILVERGANEIVVIECKAIKNYLDYNYIEKWLNRTIKIIKDWIRKNEIYAQTRLTFELWSLGGFEPRGIELLKKAKAETKQYSVEYLEKSEILNRINESRDTKLKELFNEYYK